MHIFQGAMNLLKRRMFYSLSKKSRFDKKKLVLLNHHELKNVTGYIKIKDKVNI